MPAFSRSGAAKGIETHEGTAVFIRDTTHPLDV
jgi:hypothetical protein